MKIIVSLGDVNGIGLECFYDALLNGREELIGTEFTLCANKNVIIDYYTKLGKEFSIQEDNLFIGSININILNIIAEAEIHFGETRSDSGALAAASIVRAADEVISGNYDAMLTLPISKESIKLGGYDFAGHTELISSRFDNKYQEIMILFCEELITALCTIHIPISEVPRNINKEVIQKKLLVLKESLIKDFGISSPRIAVLGLNPHSGENGEIGREELEIINPAIAELDFTFGAFAADGFFARRQHRDFDAVFAMYHDQGLIPLKIFAGSAGVNFTAGLPIIRTSPDHGTAFNLAGGKEKVSYESTLQAIIAAKVIHKNRSNYALNIINGEE